MTDKRKGYVGPKCPTCGGSGEVLHTSPLYDGIPKEHTFDPCPDCTPSQAYICKGCGGTYNKKAKKCPMCDSYTQTDCKPSQEPDKKERYLPCGCVRCACGDVKQCLGCGAKFCEEHQKGFIGKPSQEPASEFVINFRKFLVDLGCGDDLQWEDMSNEACDRLEAAEKALEGSRKRNNDLSKDSLIVIEQLQAKLTAETKRAEAAETTNKAIALELEEAKKVAEMRETPEL